MSKQLTSSLVFDATVRCPTSRTYLEPRGFNAANTDGFSCSLAAIDKEKRYPAVDGLKVTTCAAESFGRISESFLDLLFLLSQKAHAHASSHSLPAMRWFERWQEQISAGVAKGMARSIADALTVSAAVE